MTRRLRTEIQQSKAFATLEEEVCLEVQRTAQSVLRWVVEALTPSGLSAPHFNVLRILRGARPAALSGCAIADRMVAHDPDLTRLLDRLETAGLVEKTRDASDRRVVNAHITPTGVRLVESASLAVRARMRAEMGALGPRKLGVLANLLEELRGSTA